MRNNLIFLVPLRPKTITIKIEMKLVRLLGIVFLLVVSVSLTSCGGFRKGGPEGDGESMITQQKSSPIKSENSEMALALERETVLDRVKRIYTIIHQECTYLGGSVDSDLLDKTFCSKRWNQLLMAVRAKEFQTNTLFFEVNRWTMAYDPDLINFDEFEVSDIYISPNNQKTAVVNFTVFDMDSYTPARLELVYEDGQWKIDNFHHMKYMLDLRQSMYHYLHNDMLYLI